MVTMLISVEDVASITATVRVDVILDDLPDPPSELREGFKHGAQTPLWKPLEPLEREELEKTITNLIAKEEDFQDAQEDKEIERVIDVLVQEENQGTGEHAVSIG
ncbi:hypothetical protein GOBAR_DD11080 [Gossypium barbadense]|nr:hypothetical protein GOBAR_DD11080 [Gossypium barbadense]